MDQLIKRTASLEIISAPMIAGEPRTFYLSGEYFELIDAPGGSVDVVLSDEYGSQRGLMRQAEASFYLKATPFKVVQLTSPTTQVIRFGYGSGEGGTRRAAGAVSIVGTVAVSGPLTDAQLRAAPVPARTVEAAGASWINGGTFSGFQALTIFAAGANTNGAIILHMESQDAPAGYVLQTFVAKATAPATVTDGEVLAQSTVIAVAGSTIFSGIKRENPVRIPAGLGLYFVSNAAGVGGMLRNCRYILL